MPGNTYNITPPHVPGRVERLLRDRELRKNIRASQSNDATENNKGILPYENDICLREDDYSRGCKVEEATVARILNEGCEKQDGKSIRQRLLVVANRLPVSAVRRGEDSWSLEISAGGLVSALLGNIQITPAFSLLLIVYLQIFFR